MPRARSTTTRLETSPATAAAADPTGDEIARLQKQNAALKAALSNAGVPIPEFDDAGRAHPSRPSFGLSAGEQNDLKLNGVTTDAFTGKRLVAGEGLAADVEPTSPAAKANVERWRERVVTDETADTE